MSTESNFKEPHAQLDIIEIHCGKFQIILRETIGVAHTRNYLKETDLWTDRPMDDRATT